MFKIYGEYNTAKVFLSESDVDDNTKRQIESICDNPAYKGNNTISIMPDCHAGTDSLVGFTMQLGDVIDPKCLGPDIGCGVLFVRTSKKYTDFNLKEIDNIVRDVVPMGFNIHEHEQNIKISQPIIDFCKRNNIEENIFKRQIGTLGGGNHFIEFGVDKNDFMTILIHTGSRGIGDKVYKHHLSVMDDNIENEIMYNLKLKGGILSIKNSYKGKEIEKKIQELKIYLRNFFPKKNMFLHGINAYQYKEDAIMCQNYGKINRLSILKNIWIKIDLGSISTINIPHNYIDIKRRMIRKGSVSARDGETVVIPLNMRDGFIVGKGKGNPYWNYSAPHGAGRTMSRTDAKNNLSVRDFENSMTGIYSSSIGVNTLDESPFAYKNSDIIIKAIEDSVEIKEIVKPILNIKAK